jgi:hypothetical protein
VLTTTEEAGGQVVDVPGGDGIMREVRSPKPRPLASTAATVCLAGVRDYPYLGYLGRPPVLA